jgi:hypothetical protein
MDAMNLTEFAPFAGPAATLVVGLIVGLSGIWQYADKKQQSNREPFLKLQMDFCVKACDAVGHMISDSDSAKWQEARAIFWAQYWGTLAIVEDRNVEAAMVAMGQLVPPPNAPVPETLPMTNSEFQQRSLQLSHTVRNLLLRSWNINRLGTLATDYALYK